MTPARTKLLIEVKAGNINKLTGFLKSSRIKVAEVQFMIEHESQHRNRETVLRRLVGKLGTLERRAKLKELGLKP